MAEPQISQEERETDSGGGAKENAAAGTKRQRRPSVRLGDIGGGGVGGGDAHHFYYPDHQTRRRATKQPATKQTAANRKSSKQTLVNDNDNDNGNVNVNSKHKRKNTSNCENDDDFGDGIAIGSWRNKAKVLISKRVAFNGKRARSNSISKSNQNQRGNDGINRSFEPINSEEVEEEDQDQEQQELDDNASPITSSDNDDDGNDNDDGVEREGDLKFNDRSRKVRVLDEMEGPSDSSERNGVRVWLNKMGLGHYAPVFEIHEVDDQVLPMLTLDDLKDMGINAVGARRKMYCSIQTLKKGLP